MTPALKVVVAGLAGGVVPVAAIVVPTVTSIDWLTRWPSLLICYGLSAAASAALYWMKSPAGREIWSEADRQARREGKL